MNFLGINHCKKPRPHAVRFVADLPRVQGLLAGVSEARSKKLRYLPQEDKSRDVDRDIPLLVAEF